MFYCKKVESFVAVWHRHLERASSFKFNPPLEIDRVPVTPIKNWWFIGLLSTKNFPFPSRYLVRSLYRLSSFLFDLFTIYKRAKCGPWWYYFADDRRMKRTANLNYLSIIPVKQLVSSLPRSLVKLDIKNGFTFFVYYKKLVHKFRILTFSFYHDIDIGNITWTVI